MKKIGEYTTRGKITTDETLNRIILFDGRFDTAYRVVEFVIAHSNTTQTAGDTFAAKLLTDDDSSTGVGWNWENNEEIAWAMYTSDANSTIAPTNFNLVDPDNLVVQDLYIIADEGTGDVKAVNYFIRLEKYDISDSQGVLAMVRNRSQA